MNFYSYLNNPNLHGKNIDDATSVAQDAAPKSRSTRYIIDCSDADKELLNLLKYIKKNAGTGHSFAVTVDPDSSNEKTFFIDGDGSDSISTIIESKEDDDIIGLLLANLQIIRWICRDDSKPPILAIKEISDTCDALLSGHLRDSIRPLQEFVSLVKENTLPSETNPNWTENDALEHIKSICEEYEKTINSITKMKPKE